MITSWYWLYDGPQPPSGWTSQGHIYQHGGKKVALRGGGGHGSPFSQPPPSWPAVTGVWGFRAGVPDLPCQGGGGVNPTSMAQNDTQVALIILTTQMWGGK